MPRPAPGISALAGEFPQRSTPVLFSLEYAVR